MDYYMLKKFFKYISFALPLLLWSQNETAKINRIDFNRIEVVGFSLKENSTVSIKGTGAGGENELRKIHGYQDDPFNLFAYAWILNANSRESAGTIAVIGAAEKRVLIGDRAAGWLDIIAAYVGKGYIGQPDRAAAIVDALGSIAWNGGVDHV